MNFSQLNSFIAVAETLSFTKAAQKLNFVQSAVSSNISELEKELGVELFTRSNRMVRLTDIGKELLVNAYKITSLADDCHYKCDQFKKGLTGNLTVGYVFAPTIKSVLAPIKAFSDRCPEINVKFHCYSDDSIIQAALENDADLLVICPDTMANYLSVISFKHMLREGYCVVVDKSHPLAGEHVLRPEQLTGESFCIMDRKINTGLYSDIFAMCSHARFSPRIIAECNAVTALMLTLKIHRCLTILPVSWQNYIGYLAEEGETLTFIPLAGSGTERTVGYAWSKTNHNPALEKFLSELDNDPDLS